MTKKSLHSLVAGFSLILILCSACNEKVTVETLLKDMADREKISYFPGQPFTHRQFSSYNRASTSPDDEGWFENFDMSNFIRMEEIEGRREFVLFDEDGPGAIVRWWMTFYKAQDGILRIYIDNAHEPEFEGNPGNLLSGDLLAVYPLAVSVQEGAPIGEVGRDYDHNFYLPLPFSEHCKITYECDSLVKLYNREGIYIEEGYYWPDVFYNIGCRFYEKGTRVESIQNEKLASLRPLIDKTCNELMNHSIEYYKEESFNSVIVPGDSLVLNYRENGKCINRMKVMIDSPDEVQSLRSVLISARFDDLQTIWAPVGAFFGTGYSQNTHITWMNLRNEDGSMESFWVMPFRKSCEIALINFSKDTVRLSGKINFEEYNWKPESMYFGASWHEYRHINSRDRDGNPYDLNYIDISGKGIYAGDMVTIYNNTYHWWGEGDEKIFTDGETFPSSFGTGTEDYYGYSFARPEPFSHPFLSQPVGTGNTNRGLTVNMRLRSLDAIPFQSSIISNMELWHWKKEVINYALTSFWYIQPPFETNIQPDIKSVQYRVARPGEDISQ